MKPIKSGVYKSGDLTRILGNSAYIYRAVESGKLEKVGRGFYRTPDISEPKAISLIVHDHYKDAIVSKRTLLAHYQLSDYDTQEMHLDVKNESSYRLDTDLFSFHRSKKISHVTTDDFDGVKLKCYTVERAVFECLSLDQSLGQLCREVAARYVKLYPYNAEALAECAEIFGNKGSEFLKLIQAFYEAGDIH